MNGKLSALHKTDSWDLVPLPPGKTVVGCHWVYKIKILIGLLSNTNLGWLQKNTLNNMVWIMRHFSQLQK
jgi:hypothetical protein